MIARVEGMLLEKAPTRLVVDVAGVGYELLVSLQTFERLPLAGKTVARVVTELTPLGRDLKSMNGSFKVARFGSRIERVFRQLGVLARSIVIVTGAFRISSPAAVGPRRPATPGTG